MSHTYLLFDYFEEIFLEYFWNILEKISKKIFEKIKFFYNYFIKVSIINLAKKSYFQKNSNPFTNIFTT